ncbi:MAG: sulfite exporter TauE/SafE family protein [Deferribacterales bacterium]
MNDMFLIALNSSMVLGLIHGVNPCGHSWVVLAPFVSGNKSGKSVAAYTLSFISGTALACLLMGYAIGAISGRIPESVFKYLEYTVAGVIIVLGLVLMYRPSLLHSHDHCESKPRKTGMAGLFTIGFVNMIIPCPTLSLMYGYGLNAKSAIYGVFVFGAYAVTTGLAVSAVIFAIYKISELVHKMHSHKIENILMRSTGALTVVFGGLSLYLG